VTVNGQELSSFGFEFPITNRVSARGPYRYIWGATVADPVNSTFMDQIIKLDLQTGEKLTWQGETPNTLFPGEPLFVATPSSSAEDDGILLSVVYDSVAQNSYLMILHAATLTEIGRATTPNLVPLGFHGRYYQV